MQPVTTQGVAVQPIRTRTNVHWVKPLPLWAAGQADARQPRLVKLSGDNFLPDFLDAMGGKLLPDETPGDFLSSDEHELAAPEDSENGVLKLYQPAHGRFYLVTASLICLQAGLPDRQVRRSQGERASFVVRRMLDGAEQGWVEDGPRRGWQPLVDSNGQPVSVLADEERLPLHPVAAAGEPVGTQASDPLSLALATGRTVYYGYIPAGNREKYGQKYQPVTGSPAAAVQGFVNDVRAASPGIEGSYDLRFDQIDTRVLSPWNRLITDEGNQNPTTAQKRETSLYLLVDLDDLLQRALPDVFAALGTSGGALAPGPIKDLFNMLGDVTLDNTSGAPTLAAVLSDLKPYIPLANGEGDEPATHYDVTGARLNGTVIQPADLAGPSGTLYQAFSAAVQATPFSTFQAPQEVLDLLQDQVKLDGPADPAAGTDVYVLRLVYEYPPCSPVVSDPTRPFTLARFFDPDAPARHIRIELPSIDMKDLRKYKRGVGLQMSPQLRQLMARVNKDMLKGDGLGPDPGGFELAMICSFSLQIIFLVAFIVMFIFLLMLNFVFWWLPFLKICFPIPKKSS